MSAREVVTHWDAAGAITKQSIFVIALKRSQQFYFVLLVTAVHFHFHQVARFSGSRLVVHFLDSADIGRQLPELFDRPWCVAAR